MVLSISTICLLSMLCYSLSAYINREVTAFLLLLALSAIAMLFEILPVLVSAMLSALIWDYFFLSPKFAFTVGRVDDLVTLSMFFLIALLNAVLTFKIRQAERITRDKEEKAHLLKLYHTMLNSLSHEFRTPLATIIGASDSLLGNEQLTATDKIILLRNISKSSFRLNRQVENLLNISRLESGFFTIKKSWCDVHDLITTTLAQLSEETDHHHILISAPDELPLFELDAAILEQVLYNLLYNAVQYTPPGSELKIAAARKENGLVLTVSDNGPGFRPADRIAAFDKFYRPRNAKPGGTGLGLSIVKGFVESHNGTVTLGESASGGACFTIIIPSPILFIPKTQEYELT